MTEKITPDAAVQKGPKATPNLPTAKAGQVLAPSSVQPRQQQADCVSMVLNLRPAFDLLTTLLETAKKIETTNFKVQPIIKEFKDCNEAVRWVNATQTQADAMPIIQPTLSTNKLHPVKQPDGSWKVEVNVSWSIDPKQSTITLPEWTNVKSADKSAWQDYRNALRAHEVLHIRIAEEYTKKVSCTVSSTGASPKEAGENLQEKLNRYREAVGSLLDDLTGPNSEYDKITDHGLKQSKIGGKDVRLNCPPPAP